MNDQKPCMTFTNGAAFLPAGSGYSTSPHSFSAARSRGLVRSAASASVKAKNSCIFGVLSAFTTSALRRSTKGLGVPPGTPSLGELLAQGKANIDAWWISLFTFGVLVLTLMLLTFMGDALRDALDPRKLHQETSA